MNRMDYAQAVIQVRVMEKRLLNRQRLERMIEAESPKEAFRLLGETDYARSMAGVNGFEEYEQLLKNEIERSYGAIRPLMLNQDVMKILELKYDYHNLRVLQKGHFKGEDLSGLMMDAGTIKAQVLKRRFETDEFGDMDPLFKEAVDEAKKQYDITKDAQIIDLILDKFYYRHLLAMANKTGVEAVISYVKNLIDFSNVISLLRGKRQGNDLRFLEEIVHQGGAIERSKVLQSFNDQSEAIANRFLKEDIGSALKKGLDNFLQSGQLSDLEKASDDYLLELSKESKYTVFGPEPLFTYLLSKEREISNLRLIMVGKINDIAPQVLRERLRETYA